MPENNMLRMFIHAPLEVSIETVGGNYNVIVQVDTARLKRMSPLRQQEAEMIIPTIFATETSAAKARREMREIVRDVEDMGGEVRIVKEIKPRTYGDPYAQPKRRNPHATREVIKAERLAMRLVKGSRSNPKEHGQSLYHQSGWYRGVGAPQSTREHPLPPRQDSRHASMLERARQRALEFQRKFGWRAEGEAKKMMRKTKGDEAEELSHVVDFIRGKDFRHRHHAGAVDVRRRIASLERIALETDDPVRADKARRKIAELKREPGATRDNPHRRDEASRQARRQMAGSTLRTYEITAINRHANKKCELDVDASSPTSAMQLALGELGTEWEIKEIELKD